MVIHKRGDQYQARVDMGIDQRTGKRRQISATFRLQRDAERWERERMNERDRGEQPPDYDRRPLSVYLAEWLSQRKRLRPSSRRLYQYRIDRYITPYVGSVPVASLKAAQIHQLIYGELSGHKLSSASLVTVLSLLRNALGDAERLDRVPRNEAARVEMPSADPLEHKHWTAPQVRRYLAVAREDSYWPVWLVAAHTGMRRGELAGLRWGDLDAEHGIIAVVQQVNPEPGGRGFGPPKTAGSRRLVALAPSVVSELLRHKAAQNERRLLLGKLWHENDLLFPTPLGEPLHPSILTGHHRTLCQSAGLEPIRLHDMRHTASSLLHELGVPMRVVSNQLGHADVAMTARYTHADLSMQVKAAAALEQALGEKEPDSEPGAIARDTDAS